MRLQGSGQGRLLLLRHGQGMLGTEDYDRLSGAGRQQSELLAGRLADELGPGWPAWSGSLKRHRQTLQALGSTGTSFIDPRLNEYRVDELMKRALEQAVELQLELPPEQAFADPVAFLETFLAWFPAVLDHWQRDRLLDPANGTWADFRLRVLAVVGQWQAELAAGRDVVAVTSAGVISTLAAELLGRGLDWQRELNVSLYNASVTELILDRQGQWRLGRVNCVVHLEARGLITLA